MDMQDKELDSLFKNKFDGLEVEPSAELWANIAGDLTGEKKRRPLAVYYSAAATIVVAIGAALWLWPAKMVKPHNELTQPTQVATATTTQKEEPAVAATEPEQQAQPAVQQVAAIVKVSQVKTAGKTVQKATQAQALLQKEIEPAEQQLAAITTAKQKPDPVVPDNDVPLAVEPIIATKTAAPAEPVVAAVVASQAPVKDMEPAKEQPRRKRRSLFGSIVNTVVAVVDRREDKLIELDAENGDKLTGVNLGFVKITRDK